MASPGPPCACAKGVGVAAHLHFQDVQIEPAVGLEEKVEDVGSNSRVVVSRIPCIQAVSALAWGLRFCHNAPCAPISRTSARGKLLREGLSLVL